MLRAGSAALILVSLLVRVAAGVDEYELAPIEYSRSIPENRVARLQSALESKDLALRHEARQGYLRDLLEKLEIRPESQILVFSKTSVQRHLISPRTPRALYFNEDTYVGYCQSGEVLEIAAADARLGAVFYTLDQSPQGVPSMMRETDRCLLCHGGSQTDGIPGFVVRSLFVDRGGVPLLAEGSRRVDQTTPLEDRWGGWYVTGTHGQQKHLGNLVIANPNAAKPWKNDAGLNLTDLGDRFQARDYLTPHSDMVALLVFEHQTFVQNLMIKASFAARQALHYEAEFKRAVGEPEDTRLESTTRRIASAGDQLLQGLLFVDEAAIQGPIAGNTEFARQFVQRGLRDRQGRSLRDFDLTTRIFKYPCSFLIYSRAFDDLPPVMKEYVAGKLQEILAGRGGEKFAHLSAADRQAIGEILRETKPDLWGADGKRE